MSLHSNHRKTSERKLEHVLGHGYATREARPPAQGGVALPPAPSRQRRVRFSRFRVGRIGLLSEGLVLGILGGFALAWSMANLRFGTEGIPVLCLLVTPAHGGLLLVGGALAVLACPGQWTTAGYTALAVVGWGVLTVVSAVEAAHHTPGALGFDNRDTMLYAVLTVYNLALAVLVMPTVRARWRSRHAG
ncbi:hypothetical protein MMAD_45030 [Mycolicibacterium madagascariense]|uniref:Uncharacterized protein n=1 Tax=Mycolicibacterium madagascariense TaxID=212765 RepID=A0A7I7XLT6_9MYCO|nr:hypothetical protein [Mycolicibacterium madagascariense]MCV7012528.1 hypothetical protein [Mycolicibacterium madagascariense]BBZ30208.1 hypothetical protein MMAD_45030 [Mycolicibacterium madagascariense]